MTPQGILIGLAAGLASALLFAGLVTQSVSALGLSLAAPIPILLASLGWGSASGFIAALSAGALIALVSGTSAGGLILLASMALPAAIIGHLCGLARPREERTGRALNPANDGGQPPLDWYPLERVLFATAILSAVGCIVIGWVLGFDADEMVPMLREALATGGASGIEADEAQIEDIARLVVGIVPFVQPAFLVVNLVTTLYLSAAIARMSGRMQRPRDDVPASAGLPRVALPAFALALALSFLGGPLGLLAAVFAGALGAAFTLVGLAAFHHRTRGRAARGLLLFTVYMAIVVLTLPLFVFLVYGVFASARSGTPSSRAT